MLGLNIGNYKVTAAIGEGGMGAVYRAVHETLGRSAAVKVLLPEISSSRDMVTRFFNEARSAASIRHPGIVEAYDFGFLPDGRAYIIMELLEGENLASRLRRVQRMPHARALQIVRSVARALHAAHERGIVHRDIKPDNIFLVPDPEMPAGERIKLLDFGIAKLGGDGPEAGLTRTGTVMGTPTYMAPEQCRGAGSVDRRADLYALGCILYEMLCGRPPFVAEGAGDIIAHHLYFQPQPPRSHDPGITPALEALVMALLQKDPALRPPTAQDLVEAIDRLGVPAGGVAMQLGEPVPAPAGSPVTTLSNASGSLGANAGASSRRRLLFIASGAIAATAVIAIAAVASRSGKGAGDGPATPPIAAAPERQPAAAADAPPATPPPPADAAIAAVPVDAAVAAVPVDAAEVSAAEPPGPAAVKPKREKSVAAAPPPLQPQNVPPNKLEANRLGGNKQIAPDTATKAAIARSGKNKLVGSYKLCLDAQGAISSVSQLKSTGFPDYDAKILGEMKQWTFKPYVSRGEAVPVCTAVTFIYSQSGSPPPSPSSREVSPTCSRSSFTAVLQAKQPDEATVQAALARLKKCQKELPADVYAELQQQLISKL